MPLRAVVADDDDRFRAAVLEVLGADARIVTVADVAGGSAAAAAVAEHRPDAVVLDLRMPDGGIDVVLTVRELDPGTTVVVLSADLDARTVAALLRAGARGVLAKGNLADLLPEMIARCCAGEVVLATPSAHRAMDLLLRS